MVIRNANYSKLKYQFLPIRLAENKTIDDIQCCQGSEKKKTLIVCFWKCNQVILEGIFLVPMEIETV